MTSIKANLRMSSLEGMTSVWRLVYSTDVIPWRDVIRKI